MPKTTKVALLLVLVCGLPLPGEAQTPELDLLIQGGHVIDPKNGIDRIMDVGILQGKIARVAAQIPEREARRVASARGMYVLPGLIDIHTHVYYGTDPDAYLGNGI